MFKVNNKQHISHIFLVFLFLTLNIIADWVFLHNLRYKLMKIQTDLICQDTSPKLTHKTHKIINHKHSGLKCTDVNFKIASLQCSWLKHLYNESLYEWKIIPLLYLKNTFGNNTKFHPNLQKNKKKK